MRKKIESLFWKLPYVGNLREKKGCEWVVYSLNTLSSKHIVVESLLQSYIVLVHNSYPSTRSQSFKPTKHKPMISTVTR